MTPGAGEPVAAGSGGDTSLEGTVGSGDAGGDIEIAASCCGGTCGAAGVVVFVWGGATAVDFGAAGAALRGLTLVSGAAVVAGDTGAADAVTEGVGAGADA
jgi:hypothetical protein